MSKIDIGYALALDPGPTAGCCIFNYSGGYNYTVTDAFLIPWESRYQMMQDLFLFTPITALVYEKFVLYPDKAEGQAFSAFETVQSAEIFKVFAWINKLDHLLVALPAHVKGSDKPGKVQVQIRPQDEAKLNRGAYKAKDWEHVKDAYQLGRYYLISSFNRK